MTTSPNIEKLFLKYMEDIGESPGGLLGFLKPKNLEEGDPKTLGKEIQIGAAFLQDGINNMYFYPWELEEGKTGSRLEKAIQIYRQMGEEIEMMTGKEPKEYHLYLIAILIDIISSLVNHIEIRIEENQD